MRHLGTRTSAYVDGRLSGRQLARAEAHLARCGACARQVAAEREVRARLRGLRGAEPPEGLDARLVLAASPPPGARWESLRYAADRVSLRSWRRRMAGRVIGASGVLATALVGVVVLGGAPDVGPPEVLRAAAGDGAAFRATFSADADSTEATTAALRAAGWAMPADLPVDLHISGATIHRDGAVEVLEVEVVGTTGAAAVLQVRGEVDPAGLPEGARAVQCGPVAAVVTGEVRVRERVAGLLPAAPVDSSVAGRFDRGVTTIVSYLQDVAP